ncbi:MAG: serine/threonine protein kinase [Cyanobacteria bacterium SZAS-4]|nr:serine/threonine protein kinase [Cyanobacteria bacterium SZAS-4]
MIESKTRDSGGFDQNVESTTAPPPTRDVDEFEEPLDPLLNTVFAEKYRIQKVLGTGGMSVVYLALHEALNKLVAIKTLHTHLSSKTSSLMRFKQEAQAASRLQHPGIVSMHDYGVSDDGTPYLVMDYVPGESLADLLSKTKFLTNNVAIDIFEQTAAAISHAHQRGIVHRDIKPSNIMLNFDDRNTMQVKIVDFGVAKFVESEENTKLTQTGEALGSPLYMSPEQCLGQPLDIRSDIYSFGCVMYEAITGEPAHASDGVFKTMMKHIHDVPPSFKEVRPDLSDIDALERIVFKALAKDPAKRYQEMDDMLVDLNAVHEKKGIAQKIKNKLELNGLRRTAKSMYLTIAFSALLGAATLSGANFIISVVKAGQPTPELMSENPIWHAYADKPAIEDKDQDKSMFLGAAVDLALQGQEQALKNTRGIDTTNRLFDLGCAELTKANSQRKHHEYDLAVSEYSDAIRDLMLAINRDTGVMRSNAKEKLMLAYLGKGDCVYFKPKPNYKTASYCYGQAIDLLTKTKKNYIWTQLQTKDQLYLFIRNADSYFMRGLYPEAAAARLHIGELMRSADRDLRDWSYVALGQSKMAEESFRQNKLEDAKIQYEKALTEWQQDGDTYVEEQAIVIGRLAEIAGMQNSAEQERLFAEFEKVAEKIHHDDPRLLRTPFFSDVYQAYAHYLWQHFDIQKTLKMHERSVQCNP